MVAPQDTNDYTRYFLDNPRKAHRIEVFVLKDYLPQKLKLNLGQEPLLTSTEWSHWEN